MVYAIMYIATSSNYLYILAVKGGLVTLLHAALAPVALQLVVESDTVVLVVACDLVALVVEWTLVMVLLTHHHLLL